MRVQVHQVPSREMELVMENRVRAQIAYYSRTAVRNRTQLDREGIGSG
ncbi:MAG TPA: hypothetical protein VD902_16490 [Symbiobacteriaceae bacterium]|nr:hypothetical protein [Symbiobacteriaceae bacterium]